MNKIIYIIKILLGFYESDYERNYSKYSKDYIDYKKVVGINYDK